MTFEEVKEIFKKSIDTTDNMNQAIENLIQSIYLKGYNDAFSNCTIIFGTCKDCKHYCMDEDGHGYHCEKYDYTRFPVYADFYCANFEKRGNENE